MGCSFGSPAGVVIIRFRSLYAPQNLNLERLPEKPRSSEVSLLARPFCWILRMDTPSAKASSNHSQTGRYRVSGPLFRVFPTQQLQDLDDCRARRGSLLSVH